MLFVAQIVGVREVLITKLDIWMTPFHHQSKWHHRRRLTISPRLVTKRLQSKRGAKWSEPHEKDTVIHLTRLQSPSVRIDRTHKIGRCYYMVTGALVMASVDLICLNTLSVSGLKYQSDCRSTWFGRAWTKNYRIGTKILSHKLFAVLLCRLSINVVKKQSGNMHNFEC